MPESFDTLLSEIAETAGSAVHPTGSVAARRRGHQRAVRRRVAASVLSVALLGGAGGLSFALATHNSATPAPITHSNTPTPTPSTPASPSASASSSSPSPSASASSTTPSVTGDLHTVVPAAWTPVNQFPFSSLNWKANMSQASIETGERQWFYTCWGATTLAHLGASGYQHITYNATRPGGTSDAAEQVMFFFPSTSAAEQALATIQNDYAHCPEQTTGLNGVAMIPTLQQTEQLDGSYAWLHYFRTGGGAPGDTADIAPDNHEYFAQRGDVVEMVWIGNDSAIDNSSGDLSFLNSLNANLCVYGGKCPASAHPLTASIVSSTGATSLALGGSPLEFGVTVTNNSDDTIRNVRPIISLGHCTCVNTPVPVMPKGEMQVWSDSSSSWKTISYDAEGSGMDYLLSLAADQVAAFDLQPGQSVSFKYRVQLYPASQQVKLTAPYRLTNGTSSINVTLAHPGATPYAEAQIGTSPTAALPVTVTVN